MAIATLRSFVLAGYTVFPLKVRGKVPAHVGWRTRVYDRFDFGQWLRRGGNVGFRLGPTDLVIDDDPRNRAPGDDPLARLSASVGTDLTVAPSVITGGGGRHHFWKLPRGLRVKSRLSAYPGLDFKSAGGFVVAVGSIHPETGQAYRTDATSPSISSVAAAPQRLIDLLAKPRPDVRPRQDAVGILSNEELAGLLDALDPTDFGKGFYSKWIRLCAAAHDATAGAGLEAFLEWCSRDPDYGAEAHEDVPHHWNSFQAGKPGGVSCRSLFRAVMEAGRADLVAQIEWRDDDLLAALEELLEKDDG